MLQQWQQLTISHERGGGGKEGYGSGQGKEQGIQQTTINGSGKGKVGDNGAGRGRNNQPIMSKASSSWQ
jgi:hypothetical protein